MPAEAPYGGLGWPVEPEPIECQHEHYETLRVLGSRLEIDLCHECAAGRHRRPDAPGAGWISRESEPSPAPAKLPAKAAPPVGIPLGYGLLALWLWILLMDLWSAL